MERTEAYEQVKAALEYAKQVLPLGGRGWQNCAQALDILPTLKAPVPQPDGDNGDAATVIEAALQLIEGGAPASEQIGVIRFALRDPRLRGDGGKRLKLAIGGLRSIAYGDPMTWPKQSAREVAKQALRDCGGEKYPDALLMGDASTRKDEGSTGASAATSASAFSTSPVRQQPAQGAEMERLIQLLSENRDALQAAKQYLEYDSITGRYTYDQVTRQIEACQAAIDEFSGAAASVLEVQG